MAFNGFIKISLFSDKSGIFILDLIENTNKERKLTKYVLLYTYYYKLI